MKVNQIVKVHAAARLLAESRYEVRGMPIRIQPHMTGINGVVMWASEGLSQGKRLKHGPRIKISNVKNTFDPYDNFSLDFTGEVVSGKPRLTPRELARCQLWVRKNAALLMEFWSDQSMPGDEFYRQIKSV